MLGELLRILDELLVRSSATINAERASGANEENEMKTSENEFDNSEDGADTEYDLHEADQPFNKAKKLPNGEDTSKFLLSKDVAEFDENTELIDDSENSDDSKTSDDNESTLSEISTRKHVTFAPNATQASDNLKLSRSCGSKNLLLNFLEEVISSFDKTEIEKSAEETSRDSGIRSQDETLQTKVQLKSRVKQSSKKPQSPKFHAQITSAAAEETSTTKASNVKSAEQGSIKALVVTGSSNEINEGGLNIAGPSILRLPKRRLSEISKMQPNFIRYCSMFATTI